jgi:uncharacterized protein YjbI with pentapeptide repeats
MRRILSRTIKRRPLFLRKRRPAPAAIPWKQILTGSLVLAAILVAMIALYRVPWSGFAAYVTPKLDTFDYHSEKNLWDWLGLLGIPIVLAVGGYLFTRAENKTERDIAADRLRDAALREYLDRMADLLLTHKLASSSEQDPARFVARARTLTVLTGLGQDGARKGSVIRFLREAGLINVRNPIVQLKGADLRFISMSVSDLSNTDLSMAEMDSASLSVVDLTGANLSGTKLSAANLFAVRLDHAFLNNTDFTDANLAFASLRYVDAREAKFTNAYLHHAHFTEANLAGAKVTAEQLTTADSLKGAIVPDGSKHD